MISINQPMQALFKHMSHIDSRDKLTKKTSHVSVQNTNKAKKNWGRIVFFFNCFFSNGSVYIIIHMIGYILYEILFWSCTDIFNCNLTPKSFLKEYRRKIFLVIFCKIDRQSTTTKFDYFHRTLSVANFLKYLKTVFG